MISFCGPPRPRRALVQDELDDHNYILVAIDGFVYWAAFPFLTWTKAANIGDGQLQQATRVWFETSI